MQSFQRSTGSVRIAFYFFQAPLFGYLVLFKFTYCTRLPDFASSLVSGTFPLKLLVFRRIKFCFRYLYLRPIPYSNQSYSALSDFCHVIRFLFRSFSPIKSCFWHFPFQAFAIRLIKLFLEFSLSSFRFFGLSSFVSGTFFGGSLLSAITES